MARGEGTLKLTPDQQRLFLAELPDLTVPAPGGWGRMGMTLIRLDAPEEALRGALLAAHRNVVGKQAASTTGRLSAKAGTRLARLQ